MNTIEIILFVINLILSAIVASLTMTFQLGQYKEKVDQLEKCDFQRRLSHMEGQYSAASIVQSKSPVSLTATGEKLLLDSKANNFVDENLNELIKKIKNENPASAYDVQEKAKVVITSYKENEKYIPLKDFAFKQGIDLGLIETVASLYLRDKALSKFGFTTDDVDKTTPKN